MPASGIVEQMWPEFESVAVVCGIGLLDALTPDAEGRFTMRFLVGVRALDGLRAVGSDALADLEALGLNMVETSRARLVDECGQAREGALRLVLLNLLLRLFERRAGGSQLLLLR